MAKDKKNKPNPGQDRECPAGERAGTEASGPPDQRAPACRRPTPSRRSFFWKLWIIVGGIALVEYVVIALNFLRPRENKVGSGEAAVVVAGPLERFDPNTVTAFPQGKFYLA